MITSRKPFGLLLLIAACLLGGCAWSGSQIRPVIAMGGEQMDVQDPVENGRALLVTGQYGLAIDALARVVHDEPQNARARVLLAVAYDHLKRYDLADRYHAEALQIDPNSIAALNNWGYSFLVRGDRARATGLLERAIAAGGDRPVVTANLALASGAPLSGQAPQPETAPTSLVEQNRRISDHVTLVRRTGMLIRVAPGVQMLVTQSPPAAAQAPLQISAAQPAEPEPDPRFTEFRKLFAAMEEGAPAVPDVAMQQTPFTAFAGVDDFFTL